MEGTLRRLGYAGARRLLLVVGVVVIGAVALVMYLRDVETNEVIATLFFIPIFVAFVFWDLKGGVIAACLAALGYILLRYPAIEAVGSGRFLGLIFSRGLGYLAFGAIGGTANQVLESSLQKLELYDQIDDATGLFNARFFVQDTDLELSRSKRYQTVFSVSVLDFPVAALEVLSRRQRAAVAKDLGRLLGESVRTVDRGVHGTDGSKHRIAVVMPETGPEGARIFSDRLQQKVIEYLRSKGATIGDGQVVVQSVTFPDDAEAEVQRLRSEFAEIDRIEHPEATAAVPAP